MKIILHAAAILILLVSCATAVPPSETPPPREVSVDVLPVPAFDRSGTDKTGPYSLVEVSSRPNKITDEREWFERNGLALPQYGPKEMPARIPYEFQGARLGQTIFGPGNLLLLYDEDHSGARYVVGVDPRSHVIQYAFDFVNFLVAPVTESGDLYKQSVTWALERDGVLYVSNGHRTYASESKGKNAYLTAIDLKTGNVLWRSRPLVSNTRNFEIVGDVIVTGYGFTREPDFLYLIDRKTGEVIAKHPLKTGPDYILEKDGKLYVRAYDTDYVFEIRK
ncbi:MAG TPA: hypothetical protein VF789_29095 [Thermoanaerobaculia bacterium]